MHRRSRHPWGSTFVRLLCGVVTLCVTTSAGAQPAVGRVRLSVTVPPQATIEYQRVAVRRASLDTIEYVARIIVRANGSYRLIARRAAPVGYPVVFLRDGQRTTRLDPDRQAVQIARGESGLTTFEIRYLIGCVVGSVGCVTSEPSSALIAFEVMSDRSTVW